MKKGFKKQLTNQIQPDNEPEEGLQGQKFITHWRTLIAFQSLHCPLVPLKHVALVVPDQSGLHAVS